MNKKILEAINTIKAECENYLGKDYGCEGCTFYVTDEECSYCFLCMNPKLPCNWELEEIRR